MEFGELMDLEVKERKLILQGQELRGVIDYEIKISPDKPTELILKIAVNFIKDS
jgi:hypothetical protein